MKALRVLVVEDEPIMAMMMSEMLADMGFDICGIEPTEADAVTAAARCRPDLMIVDVWLAAGNGVSAVERILRARYVPHMLVSGDPSRARERWPNTMVFPRPIRESDLARAIRSVLDAPPPC